MRISRLGILGALDLEVCELRERLEGARAWQEAGRTFYEGVLEELPVLLSWSDVGKVNAAVTTQLLIERGKVEAVVFIGVAGATSPDLAVGDLVVANGARYHDVDVTAFGYEPGQVPRLPAIFPTDPALTHELCRACDQLGLKSKIGTIVSGDVFVSGCDKRTFLARTFGALAVEMEGAAVAHVCFLNRTPFALLRAVSDQADGSAPVDFRTFSEEAAQRAAEVISVLCRQLSSGV